MTRTFSRISLPAVLMLMLFIAVLPASADAFVNSSSGTCGSFSVAGTSNSAYVRLIVTELTGSTQFTRSFPVVSGAFDVTFSFTEQPVGTSFIYRVEGSPDGASWDNGEVQLFVDFSCVPTKVDPPAAAPAAPVPARVPEVPEGFVMNTITCDTPVYTAPAGVPVGEDRVTVGQTWYVNPVPVLAEDGSSWTEMFVAGFTHPFIPTACVD